MDRNGRMHLSREECSQEREWLACDFLRTLTRTSCVIRLHDTGAVIDIHLAEPLDITRACLVSALLPVPARVQLGAFEGHRYRDCILDVQFSQIIFPGPMLYLRSQKGVLNVPDAAGRTHGRV